MKKVIAILLAALMLLGAVSAFAEEAVEEQPLKLGQIVTYLHGNGFAVVTAVIQGETIVLAKIDEFQFMGDREDIKAIGVPVKDGTFSQTNADTGAVTVLGSKRVNSDLYSLNMQRSGSRVQIAANYNAIEAFVVGKTIAQLEAAVEVEGFADVVSGATLKDTANYVKGIIAAAKEAHAQYAGTHGGNTGTYTLWNTTGEDIVGIYMTDLDSGWQSVNYVAGAGALHTLGAEDDNNPFIITRTVTEAEVNNHMRIWAETASGKIIEFPGESEHTGLSIETANIEFANPDTITGPTQIRWFAPER
ncbi:MAG: hypothetical protein IJR97_09445 [Clostridia bacterium]|nr:hypothetical protein [Clostridia bacterium]